MRSSYSLLKRQCKTRGKLYYVRFWHYETKSYSTAKSVAVMLENLGLDFEEYSPSQKSTARIVAEQWIRKGFHRVKKSSETTLGAYLKKFWDWEESDYIKGKLARNPHSIGKQYCASHLFYVKTYFCEGDIGKTALSKVTTAMIEKVILDLHSSGKYKGRTLNNVLQSIRVPLSEAVRLGLIEKNPVSPIRHFAENRAEKGILTSMEIDKLLKLKWESSSLYAAFCLALVAGLRLGEVQALRKECLLEDSILVKHSWARSTGLKPTKTNKAREIPVPQYLLALLRKEANKNPINSAWVFWQPNNPERPMTEKLIEQGFYKAMERIGISEDKSDNPDPTSRQGRNITFHSLRHGCNALLRGVLPDEKVRMVTGHQSVELTNHYDHITDQDRQAIIKAQEERLLRIRKQG